MTLLSFYIFYSFIPFAVFLSNPFYRFFIYHIFKFKTFSNTNESSYYLLCRFTGYAMFVFTFFLSTQSRLPVPCASRTINELTASRHRNTLDTSDDSSTANLKDIMIYVTASSPVGAVFFCYYSSHNRTGRLCSGGISGTHTHKCKRKKFR